MVGGDWGDMRWFLFCSPWGKTKKRRVKPSVDVGWAPPPFFGGGSTTCLFGGGSVLAGE